MEPPFLFDLQGARLNGTPYVEAGQAKAQKASILYDCRDRAACSFESHILDEAITSVSVGQVFGLGHLTLRCTLLILFLSSIGGHRDNFGFRMVAATRT
jgi:hypothetical protein